jgi:hypothetical protein
VGADRVRRAALGYQKSVKGVTPNPTGSEAFNPVELTGGGA